MCASAIFLARSAAIVLLISMSLPLQAQEAVANKSPHYPLPMDPLRLVESGAAFTAWARPIAADVGELLRAGTTSVAQQKLLLGLRVHLAIFFREDGAALEAAAKIRELQTSPAEKAHAGLTTRALVAGRYDERGFEREFTRLLRALPWDPAVRDVLVQAREKIAAMNREALRDDVRRNVVPRLARGEPCTLEIADQLVRAGHRLKNILPMRGATLRAYDAGIAAQR